MTILICCPYPLTMTGGVTDWVKQFKFTLQKLGHTVYIVGPALKREENPVDFTLGKLYKINIEDSESFVSITANFKKARKILEQIKPDIVSIQDLGPSCLMANVLILSSLSMKNRPYFVGTFISQSLKWSFKTWTFVKILKTVRAVKKWNSIPIGFEKSVFYTVSDNLAGRIAISKATARSWNEIDPADYNVIPIGVDTVEANPNGEIIEAWKKGGKKIILYTGRHDRRKGLDDLINAFEIVKKQNKNVKLIIVGYGHQTEAIKWLVKSKHIEDVEFHGFLSKHELFKAYRTCDIFASPSKYNEAFGRTLAEALSCGKIVVATKIEGFEEWLGNKPFAFLAKPQDPQSLADMLLKALELSSSEQKALGQLGSRYVKENFSIEEVTDRTLVFWERCLLAQKENPAYRSSPNYIFPWSRIRLMFAKD